MQVKRVHTYPTITIRSETANSFMEKDSKTIFMQEYIFYQMRYT